MTDAEFILSVLEDGEEHSQADLLRRSFQERGCGLTVHSRVADLRAKGHFITCRTDPSKSRGEKYLYQLLLSESPLTVSTSSFWDGLSSSDTHDSTVGGRGDSLSPQLFETSRKPEWA